MVLNPIPFPVADPIAQLRDPKLPQDKPDPNENLISQSWLRVLVALSAQISQAPQVTGNQVQLVTQGASIGATSIIPGGASTSGLYRVSYYTRITVADGVSSSLTVTIGYTDHAVSLTESGAAITGNTTATAQTQTLLLFADGLTPLTYATTYVSGGGGPAMQYQLYVTAESVVLGAR